MFDPIVVALDGTTFAERAVDAAAALAGRVRRRLVLFTACTDDPASAQSYLNEVSDRHGGALRVATEVMVGSAPAALAVLAEREPEATVFLATHVRPHGGGQVFGSVAEAVLVSSTRPLVLFGPAAGVSTVPRNGKIVVGTDGSARAEAVWPAAAALARLVALEVEVVTVAERASAAAVDELAARAIGYFADHGVQARVEVVASDDVAGALVARAATAEWLALATRGQGASQRRVAAGSVTMAVVREASCPVLVAAPVAAR